MTNFLQGLIGEAAAIKLDKAVQRNPKEVGADEVVLCVLSDELKRWYCLYSSIKDEIGRLAEHLEKGGVKDNITDLIATAHRLASKAETVQTIFWESACDFLEKQPQSGYSRDDKISVRQDWQLVKTINKCKECPARDLCPVRMMGDGCSSVSILEVRLPKG